MPYWQVLMVRSGQPEILLEASRAWSLEQRLLARVSFSLVYHAMLTDLMKCGEPNRVYSQYFAGVAIRAHAWRTRNSVCFYLSSVTFNRELPPVDSCEGLDALAYEAFDQTSEAVITRVGRTWIFEQTQGYPILTPPRALHVAVGTNIGFVDQEAVNEFDFGASSTGAATLPGEPMGRSQDALRRLRSARLDGTPIDDGAPERQTRTAVPRPDVARSNSPEDSGGMPIDEQLRKG